MTAIALISREAEPAQRIDRIALPGVREDRLYFAQVREDPRAEITALAPRPTDRVVVVSSGGCTTLSLLAVSGGEVHSVDLNATQNHLVELKHAAVSRLSRVNAIRFLGGLEAGPGERIASFVRLRDALTPDAQAYWDDRSDAIARGVLRSGVSERFIGLVAWVVTRLVQNPRRIRRMLDARSVSEQRELFAKEWNGVRWRLLFKVLLNRWAMARSYDPAFFEHAQLASFAEHFRKLADHALCDIPTVDNYFLHEMLTGRYPVERLNGVPPYLSCCGARSIAEGKGSLVLVDGAFTDHLRTLPSRSVDCFALSNICEWMSADEIRDLFLEVERTAAPGARVVFRNFVGHTVLPSGLTRLREDEALGEALTRTDRSVVQARIVVCRAGGAP